MRFFITLKQPIPLAYRGFVQMIWVGVELKRLASRGNL